MYILNLEARCKRVKGRCCRCTGLTRVGCHAKAMTTDDIVNALDYASETPRHVNVGMLELMPTFQVPGGRAFDRRED